MGKHDNELMSIFLDKAQQLGLDKDAVAGVACKLLLVTTQDKSLDNGETFKVVIFEDDKAVTLLKYSHVKPQADTVPAKLH